MRALTIATSGVHRLADGHRLLGSVSLGLEEGRSLGLVGPSGSGKSLLLRALVGLLGPQLGATGELRLNGRRFDLAAPKTLAMVRGRGLALLHQSAASSLDPTRNVDAQMLEVERAWAGAGTTRSSADDRRRALERVALPPAIGGAFAHELSGGEAQRVALALALAAKPQVLLADEPTANLDTVSGAAVLSALAAAVERSDLSLILVSHDLAQVASRCPQLAVLCAGELVESGATEDLLRAPQAEATRRLVAIAMEREGELNAVIHGSINDKDEGGRA